MGIGGGAVGLFAAAARIKKMINTPKIYKMRIEFRLVQEVPADSKHVLNAVRNMILASGLPFTPAQVNNRWPRFAYGPAPATGQRAEREYVDIYLRESCSEETVRQALVQVAPEGLEILHVRRVPYALPSVQKLAAAASYRVYGDASQLAELGRKLQESMQAKSLVVNLRNPDGELRQKELAPGLQAVCCVAPDEVELILVPLSGLWVLPQWYVAAALGVEVPTQDEKFFIAGLSFVRKTIFWRDSQGELHPI